MAAGVRESIWTTLEGIECYKCHVLFGMTTTMNKQCLETGERFFCPNGHGQVYTETEVQRLKRERDRARAEQRRYAELASQRYDEAEAARRSASARKGVITRMKNRALAGGCVFCRRNFANVLRHMETKHRDVVATEVE
jgi:hypothetical protein